LNQCTGPGALVNQIFNLCNNTIARIVPTRPPTIKDIKSLLSQCICGKTTDDPLYNPNQIAIANAWKACASCYTEGYPTDPWTAFNDTMFSKACACEEPGPIDALMNVFNPEFKCAKQSVTRGALGAP
jgi:hypothetical protein